MKGHKWSRSLGILAIAGTVGMTSVPAFAASDGAAQVLEWNQIFIDMLVATNTAPSLSPRVGAIVHTAIFDAYNGIERRYTPIYVQTSAPRGHRGEQPLSRPPTRPFSVSFRRVRATSTRVMPLRWRLSAEDDDEDGGRSRSEGLRGACRSRRRCLPGERLMGSTVRIRPFRGGTAVGQWRPTPPLMGAMSSQPLAFTAPFVLPSTILFQPPPPRGLLTQTYTDDFNAVKALGKATGSTRTDDQTWLAPFWDGNASVHWNQAANQMASANDLSMSKTVRLLTLLNVAMADTMFVHVEREAALRRDRYGRHLAACDGDRPGRH